MKEPTLQVKQLVEKDLRVAWKELGLDIVLPSLNNRIDILENRIEGLSTQIGLIEQNYVIVKARLKVLENVRVSVHMDFKALSKILRDTLAKMHESFESLKFTTIEED